MRRYSKTVTLITAPPSHSHGREREEEEEEEEREREWGMYHIRCDIQTGEELSV